MQELYITRYRLQFSPSHRGELAGHNDKAGGRILKMIDNRELIWVYSEPNPTSERQQTFFFLPPSSLYIPYP